MSDSGRYSVSGGLFGRAFAWLGRFARAALDGSGGSDEATAEKRLLAKVRRGGPEGKAAYQILVERNQNWLVYFLSSLLNDRNDAEDVAQDVFVRAFVSIDRFRGDARFKTWIRRIAINQAHNFRRAGKRYKVHEDDAPDISVEDADFDAIEERDALSKVLDKLEYDERQILILRYSELMSVGEVAEALDAGLSATKMRIKRARENFRYHYDSLTDAPNVETS